MAERKEYNLAGGKLVRDLESEKLHGKKKDPKLVILPSKQREVALSVHLADSVAELEEVLAGDIGLNREQIVRSAVEVVTILDSMLGKVDGLRLEEIILEAKMVHQEEGGYALGLFRLVTEE